MSSDPPPGAPWRLDDDDNAEYPDDDENPKYLKIGRSLRAGGEALGGGRDPGFRRKDPDLGRTEARTSKQVNVKLAIADFDALHAMALAQDLPTATLARMLLRTAIREQRQAGS